MWYEFPSITATAFGRSYPCADPESFFPLRWKEGGGVQEIFKFTKECIFFVIFQGVGTSLNIQ